MVNKILGAKLSKALGAERRATGLPERVTGADAVHACRAVDAASSANAGRRVSTEIFKRYQRSAQAFVLALMEMVVQGGVDAHGG